MRQKKIRRSWRKLYCLQLRLDINDKDLAKQTTNLKNYDVWNETRDEQLNTFIFKHTALLASRQGRFFSDTVGPVPGNLLAVERISWHAGKVLRPLLQFQCLFSLWGSLRILRVLNESSTMKIFAGVLMKDIRVWLQAEVFASENPILHFNERVKITPREKRRLAAGRENVSPFSRGVIFTRARVSLALLSLRKNEGLVVVYILTIEFHNLTIGTNQI